MTIYTIHRRLIGEHVVRLMAELGEACLICSGRAFKMQR